MPVKNRVYTVRRTLFWVWMPFLLALSACALMFRGGGSLYWGPLESDLTNQFYPWRVFLSRWLGRGVLSYWDPHIFSGYPTLETQQMLNLNPLHLLSMVVDPKVGLTAFTALNTLIGCLGMAWALRRWGRCGWMAAALGAGLYVFGALFAVRVMAGHLTVVSALAWWPLAGLSVLRIVRSVPAAAGLAQPLVQEKAAAMGAIRQLRALQRLRGLIVISVAAHAMVCLAGAPQYIVYLFYIDIAVLVATARRWTWGASLGVLAGVWVLALLISAPQWLPALWYLPYTARATASGGMSGISFLGMQNILLEMLMPFPFGDDITRGHLHFKNVWETATYPGALALALSLALVVRTCWWTLLRLVRQAGIAAPVTPLAAAGVVIFLFGSYMMIGGWLPGFGGFREPQKARALLAFGFAVMSAGAFDFILRRVRAWWPSIAIAVLLLGISLMLAQRFSEPQLFRELIATFQFPMDPLAADDYNAALKYPDGAASHYSVAWLWVAGFIGVALFLTFVALWFPRTATALLLLVALADPFASHVPAWVARHPWARAALPEPVAEYFEPKLASNQGQLPWRVILHSAVINRTHHVEGLYEYHGYDPLMPAFAAGRMLVGGAKDIPERDRKAMRIELLERVGVRYDTSAWRGLVPLELQSTETVILHSPMATLLTVTRNVVAGSPGYNTFGPDLSGVHYVVPAEVGGIVSGKPAVSADFQAQIRNIASYGTPPDAAALAGDRLLTATSTLLPGEKISHLETGRPDAYGVKVALTAPALLVYKGTWLPGWRVIIDGDDQGRALFANNWMCGALVPAGEHEVVFRYRPVAWWPAWVLCTLGIAVIAGLSAGPLVLRLRRGAVK